MSKSSKKQHDRLKDPCRHEKLKAGRHFVKQLLKEERFEEVVEDEPPVEKEKDS